MLEEINKAFRHFKISHNSLEAEGFLQKYGHTAAIFGAYSGHVGILDILFLGIPRFLMLAANYLERYIGFFNHILCIPFYIQQLLVLTLTTICIPFIALIDWLYPDRGFNTLREDDVESDENFYKGRRRRQFFFNPSTWVFLLILSAGISLWILQANPALFLEAAIPLIMVQTIFAGMAALILGGALLSLVYAGICFLMQEKSEKSQIIDSSVIEYLSEFREWCKQYPYIAGPLIIFSGVSVLVVMAMTIGYFVGSFTSLAPLFNFMTSVLTISFQGLATVPGLEFFGSISNIAMQIIGQVASTATLFLAAIFIFDNIRRVLQTIWPVPLKPWYLDYYRPDENKTTPVESSVDIRIASCDFDALAWVQEQTGVLRSPILSLNKNDLFQVIGQATGGDVPIVLKDGQQGFIPSDIFEQSEPDSNIEQTPFYTKPISEILEEEKRARAWATFGSQKNINPFDTSCGWFQRVYINVGIAQIVIDPAGTITMLSR